LTIGVDSSILFGPDAVFTNSREQYYAFEDEFETKARFVRAIKEYMPSIREDQLVPAHVGIRPKLSRDKFVDFVIEEESMRGFPGLINLVGIESPGLTSSLAIAEHVVSLLK